MTSTPDDERPYIVMAHMPGGSLWDRMQDGERSDPEPLADDILSALEAIHRRGSSTATSSLATSSSPRAARRA